MEGAKMSAKSNAGSQGRRTPLTLNASITKQQQQQQLSQQQPLSQQQQQLLQQQQQQQQQLQQQLQQLNKQATGSGANGSGSPSARAKNESRSPKTDQSVEIIEIKETTSKDMRKQTEKKSQQQQQQQQNIGIDSAKKSEKPDEKFEQRQADVGKSNGNAKEKQQQQQQNGRESNGNAKPLKEDKKSEKAEAAKQKEKEVAKEIMPEKKTERETRAAKKTVDVESPNKMEVNSQMEKPTPSANIAQKSFGEKKIVASPTKEAAVKLAATMATTHKAEKTATKASGKRSASLKNDEDVIVVIDDNDEMPSLMVEHSPTKVKTAESSVSQVVAPNPKATSTPGKSTSKKNVFSTPQLADVPLGTGTSPDRNACPRTFTQISGRRSIRPLTDYSPSRFQSSQLRESYRRINTELDVTSTSNTSLNVTVGSEVPNNSSFSFSFFGRGRKRDREPPVAASQSAMELQTDVELSPPKRARLDMHGIFSAVASPLTLLRARFAKTTIQSSTPVKSNAKDEEGEVQNVSGIQIQMQDEVPNGDGQQVEDADVTVAKNATDAEMKGLENSPLKGDGNEQQQADENAAEEEAVEVKETVIAGGNQPSTKKGGCSLM